MSNTHQHVICMAATAKFTCYGQLNSAVCAILKRSARILNS